MFRPLLLAMLLAPCAADAPGTDSVHLKDGSLVTGEVLELGTSTIDLVMLGGIKKIPRRDIERVAFNQDRSQKQVETTDVIVRQDGHRIRGKVEVLEGGQRVQVTLEGGAKAVFQQKDVLRIIRGGESAGRDTTLYTKELGASIRDALAIVMGPQGERPAAMRAAKAGSKQGPRGPDEAVKFLIECGIFAIQPVREALAKAVPDSAQARLLRRIDRPYRLKETVDPVIEAAESRVYQILTDGSAREKCDFLVLIFPRYVEESVPLAMLLATDEDEDSTVRAWSIEFLRRMQKNWRLLDIYRRSTGQVQLAAAIALSRNRIPLGIPTLIEALDFESVELRDMAGKQLRQLTGEDFLFRADGAPQARKEAAQKWRAWWQANAARLTDLAENTLRSDRTDTPERKAATELWRHAGASIDSSDLKGAEQLLRQAMQMDPGFYQAQVTLAILLYTGLQKPQEAVNLLDDARTRLSAQLVPEERQWIHLHLGHALRAMGEIDRAAASYEQTKLLVEDNIQAWLGLAEVKLAQATTRANTKPEEREKLLHGALEAATTADSLLDKLAQALTTLRFEDVPEGVELPFDRREYNRSVMDLRRKFRMKQRDLQLTIAKIRVILGEKKEGVLVLRRLIDDLGIDASDESRNIEADARAFLGTLYEEMGQALLALREYRKVLKDVKPQHAESTRGVERLRRLARQAGETGN